MIFNFLVNFPDDVFNPTMQFDIQHFYFKLWDLDKNVE